MKNQDDRKARTRQKEATGQLILKTANKLFNEKGYRKTTMRDIAKKAGVATGTTFAHFPNKASLLAATLYSGVEETLRKAYRTIPENATLIDASVHVAKKLYAHLYRMPELTRTWITELFFMKGEWADRITMQFEESRLQYRDILKLGVERGLYIPEMDCDMVATSSMSHFYFALFTGHRLNLSLNEQITLYRNLMEALLFGYKIQSREGE